MGAETEGLLASRGKLIEKLTAPDFSQIHGNAIGEALQPIIDQEAYLALHRPELYVLPVGATVDISSGLDSLIAEEVKDAWQKFSTRMQNPDHFSVITAQSRVNPHTWMKFDTTVPLLKEGRATLHLLELGGVHLPLRIAVDKGDATVLLKYDQISDEDYVL